MAPVTCKVRKDSKEATSPALCLTSVGRQEELDIRGLIPRPCTSAKNRGLVPHPVTLWVF